MYKGYGDMVIAVDFDGFLFIDGYPFVGRPIMRNINFVKTLYDHGVRLILWTCRAGKSLDRAVEACNSYGIYFVAVNDDDPILKKLWKDPQSRKIYADYYLDDRIVLNKKEFLRRLSV